MTRPRALLMLALAVACGNDDGEALAHQIDDAQRHVDELRAEVDAHADAASQAQDLAALQQAEASHGDTARGHMEELGHAIADMDECAGAPDDQLDSMMDMHDTCADELDRHRNAIASATELTRAIDEEEHHRMEMMDRLDDLGGMMDGMMDGHGMAMCSGHHGMDDHDEP
jgi:chromosome segregation ATPase